MAHKIIVTLLTVCFLTGAALAAETRLDCKVEKMHCAMCEKKINETLKEEVPGVLKSEIKTKESGGIVTIDPAKTSAQKVIETINKLGFEAKECKAI